MTNDYSVVITTTSNEEKAADLAASIIAAKLAACVQIQTIKSVYSWKGETCFEPECLLLIKTKSELYTQLEAHIKGHHDYETPEIIQLPVMAGSAEYLAWVRESTL